ncbi:MAG: hypothetical protein UX77_C0003G0053 [Parcubacteria group bacterium GW2011_GWA1_47_11]|uniref:HTH merR-type domain-containing protein n=1 Tax=Candidatus Colwellbacteria bacterium GWA2_46_10 TaxID=1797684 RepID=A0A1G1YVZ2_9BACT|nr:MAG: hypothetical protein UX29_C0001G0040 [Parcubacteria group bacterium GW2011_GWA2_46_10]KKU56175.1 MAG: hypothetical protein UX77_C0003G0053 [Parcubacteria group bacterium GW2011_GWA1_47_11]OGY56561.1 MAG: hypothetical protein A2119_01485 [Candidatus Colwellbacteria bacterium GWA2_46_10]
MNREQLTIGKAARYLQVSLDTLRRWDASGKLLAQRSTGGHRYYSLSDLQRFRIDLSVLGEAWAMSEQVPDIPSEYYCERTDRFSTRLDRFKESLLVSENFSLNLASLLVAVVGEIGDNSFVHNTGNWPDVPGVFFAYDISKHIVVLADRGRGILKTLRRVRPTLNNDRDALLVAFTEFVSGRAPENRGNGLKLVREVVETNPFELHFQSGLALAHIPARDGHIKISGTLQNIRGMFAQIKF